MNFVTKHLSVVPLIINKFHNENHAFSSVVHADDVKLCLDWN